MKVNPRPAGIACKIYRCSNRWLFAPIVRFQVCTPMPRPVQFSFVATVARHLRDQTFRVFLQTRQIFLWKRIIQKNALYMVAGLLYRAIVLINELLRCSTTPTPPLSIYVPRGIIAGSRAPLGG